MRSTRYSLGAGLLILMLGLAACTPAATPSPSPQPTATTDAYAQPSATGEATPGTSGATPTVAVGDQPIVDGGVIIASVTAVEDGWIVIHIEQDGKPGPVIGHAAVKAGESKDVKVAVGESQATPKLFAMLHVDAGTIGTYEFPGADAPVKAGDAIVMTAFSVTPAEAALTPAVEVGDQPVVDGMVSIASVTAAQDGWIVIHIEQDGKPGSVIGHAAVKTGENMDVNVTLDAAQATPKLFAMLHVDAGAVGTYEFPGPDAPVKAGDMIVMTPFNIQQ